MGMETTFRRKLWFLSIVVLVFSILATLFYGYFKHQSAMASDPNFLNKLIQSRLAGPENNSPDGRSGMRPKEDAAILFTVEEPPEDGKGGAAGGGRSGRN